MIPGEEIQGLISKLPKGTITIDQVDKKVKIEVEHEGKIIEKKVSIDLLLEAVNPLEALEVIYCDMVNQIKKGENNNG